MRGAPWLCAVDRPARQLPGGARRARPRRARPRRAGAIGLPTSRLRPAGSPARRIAQRAHARSTSAGVVTWLALSTGDHRWRLVAGYVRGHLILAVNRRRDLVRGLCGRLARRLLHLRPRRWRCRGAGAFVCGPTRAALDVAGHSRPRGLGQRPLARRRAQGLRAGTSRSRRGRRALPLHHQHLGRYDALRQRYEGLRGAACSLVPCLVAGLRCLVGVAARLVVLRGLADGIEDRGERGRLSLALALGTSFPDAGLPDIGGRCRAGGCRHPAPPMRLITELTYCCVC